MIAAKTKAPDFELQNQDTKPITLSQFLGSFVMLYFYPKDDTSGCASEACAIRDSYAEFTSAGIVVLGVSQDSPQSHQQFIKKYRLPFTLLADVDKKVVKLYDVWGPKKFMGREFLGTKRDSFLISPKGKIAKIYRGVKPAVHAVEVLNDIQTFKR